MVLRTATGCGGVGTDLSTSLKTTIAMKTNHLSHHVDGRAVEDMMVRGIAGPTKPGIVGRLWATRLLIVSVYSHQCFALKTSTIRLACF